MFIVCWKYESINIFLLPLERSRIRIYLSSIDTISKTFPLPKGDPSIAFSLYRNDVTKHSIFIQVMYVLNAVVQSDVVLLHTCIRMYRGPFA